MAFLKYPGGKESELKHIIPELPKIINNYFEPFVGGGSVYFNVSANQYFINDKSCELINLYNSVKLNDNGFFENLNNINLYWKKLTDVIYTDKAFLLDLYCMYRNNSVSDDELLQITLQYLSTDFQPFIVEFSSKFDMFQDVFIKELTANVSRKFKRMKALEAKFDILSEQDLLSNVECAFKSRFYMYFRYVLNHMNERIDISNGFKAAVYLFIREMCYSSMFRYNNCGEFNVPYGGISYNKKNFDDKLRQYQTKEIKFKFSNSIIECMDFYDFMKKHPMQSDDFMFVDPPYDTEFSSYSGNEFVKKDHERLANYLLNECEGNFMMVIKNTDFISSLYKHGNICKNGNNLHVSSFEKKYTVNFKNRNNKDVRHLLIKNY